MQDEESRTDVSVSKLNMMLRRGFIPTGPQGELTRVEPGTVKVIREQLAEQGIDVSRPFDISDPK